MTNLYFPRDDILPNIELFIMIRREEEESVTMLTEVVVVECCTMSVVSTEDRAVTSCWSCRHHEGPVSLHHRGQALLCLWPTYQLSLTQYHQQVTITITITITIINICISTVTSAIYNLLFIPIILYQIRIPENL